MSRREKAGDRRPARSPKVVRNAFSTWESRRLTDEANALSRRLLDRLGPQTIGEASLHWFRLVDFLAYQQEQGRVLPARMTAASAFSASALAGYLVDLKRRKKQKKITASTRRTLASSVFACGRALKVHNAQLDGKGHTNRTPPLPAMPDSVFTRWLEVAQTQAGAIRIQLLFLLLVVRGAGLLSEDLRESRGIDVVRRSDGVTVVRVRGLHPRTAVVLDRFAPALLEVAVEIGDRLGIGQWAGRKNVVSSLLGDVRHPVELDPGWLADRVRWAYIAEIASTDATPMQLMAQLGVQSLEAVEAVLSITTDLALGDAGLRHGTGGVGELTGLDYVSDLDLEELLVEVARQRQPIRRQLEALVRAVRGGGLDVRDFDSARGTDVRRRTDGALVIRVRGRDAVILDRFAEGLEWAARQAGDNLLVEGASGRALAAKLDALQGVKHLPRPIPRRLRKGYLVEIGSTATPSNQLRRQLGTRSLAPIESVIPWLSDNALDDSALRLGYDLVRR